MWEVLTGVEESNDLSVKKKLVHLIEFASQEIPCMYLLLDKKSCFESFTAVILENFLIEFLQVGGKSTSLLQFSKTLFTDIS